MLHIAEIIPTGRVNALTREQLADRLGVTDREVRDLITKAREDYCIINLGDGKGYFIPADDELHLALKYYRQERKRAGSVNKTKDAIYRFLVRKGACVDESA